jgi:hypothetical protein
MKTLGGIAVLVLGLWGPAAAVIAELKPDGHTGLDHRAGHFRPLRIIA